MSHHSRSSSPIGRSFKGKNTVPPSTITSSSKSTAVLLTPAPPRDKAADVVKRTLSVPTNLSADDVEWFVYTGLPPMDWLSKDMERAFGVWRSNPVEEILKKKNLFKGTFDDFSRALNRSAVVARATTKVSGDRYFFFVHKQRSLLYYLAFPSGCPDTRDPYTFVPPPTPSLKNNAGKKRAAPPSEEAASSSKTISKNLMFTDTVGSTPNISTSSSFVLAPPFIPVFSGVVGGSDMVCLMGFVYLRNI